MKTPSQYRFIGLDSVKGIIVQLQKLYYIKNTRKSVSSDIQTLRRELKKTRRSPVFFNQLRSVWLSDATLFRVFDRASQSINNC